MRFTLSTRRFSLLASSLRLAVVIGAALAISASSSPVGEAAPGATSLHVAAVDAYADGVLFPFRQGIKVYGFADVQIVDDLGNPVAGALVSGSFSSSYWRKDRPDSGVTDANGWVTLSTGSRYIHWVGEPVDYTFCVGSVDAALSYDPTANVEDCDTVIYDL